MIEEIIDIARTTIDLDDEALQLLIKQKDQCDQGLGDYRRDLSNAILNCPGCRSAVITLLSSADKNEIEHIVHTFCKDNDQFIPPIFLLGRAMMFRSESS